MKRALILIALMLMASSAWGAVKTYPTDGAGGAPTYGLPDGDGKALSNIVDWSLATGLITNSDGSIVMSNIINTDSFDDSSLDATLWTSSTSGSGSVTETTSLLLNSPAASDGAIVCYTETLNPRASKTYRIRITGQVLGSTSEAYMYYLEYNTVAPVVNSSATTFANMPVVIWSDSGAGNKLYVSSRSTAGSFEYWIPSDADGWTTTQGSVYPVVATSEYIYEVENDGTNMYYRTFLNGNCQSTSIRPLAGLMAEANDTYYCFGDPFNNLYDGAYTVTKFEHFGPYLTTSPVATMGEITVGAEIKRLGLFVNCESGGSITWRYDIGSGWATAGSGTLSELETELIGTTPATLNLEAAYNSDGAANCQLYSDGASITTD